MERDWNDFKAICGGYEGARAKFEDACFRLLKKTNPNSTVQKITPFPGDEGIDVLVGDLGVSRVDIFQCKFFTTRLGDSQKAQIRKSFKSASDSSDYEMLSWTLCIPLTFTIKEAKWWNSWKKRTQDQFKIPILLKDGDELIHELKSNGLYNDVFRIEEAVKIDAIYRALSPETVEDIPLANLFNAALSWFGVLNYSIEFQHFEDQSHFELIINVPIRRGYDRVLVFGVCDEIELYHVTSVKSEIIRQKCVEGWLISSRRISQAVVDNVDEENHVFCYTFDELLDLDADFSGYIGWLESKIEEQGINSRYIPLACRKDAIDPITQVKLGTSIYNEKNGWIDGYVDKWIDDTSKKHISILGEFGTGKTWFSLHYASELLVKYKSAKENGLVRPRLPLYIPLRDYARSVSIESLFSEFFFRKHEIPIPGYGAFELLNRMGRFLLIFDGFDEMADKVDRQKVINNFWELAKVIQGGSKAILTCRNEHFPLAIEGRRLLSAELHASTANLTGEPPQFEVLYLERLTEKQIINLLKLHTESKTIKKILENKRLLDLAKRPVMVGLIVDALPDIEADKPIDMSRIYLYAVTRKMEKDIQEARTFTSLADKVYFLVELSFEMYATETLSLNYRDFPDRITRLFGNKVREQKDLDHWHYDMMGQTMLIRNEYGDYTPAHKSLIEFFVAFKFAAQLGLLPNDFMEVVRESSGLSNSSANDLTWTDYFIRSEDQPQLPLLNSFQEETIDELAEGLGIRPISYAVMELMRSIVPIDLEANRQRLIRLLDCCRGKSFAEVKYLANNIVNLLLDWNGHIFQEGDLSNLSLVRFEIPRLNEEFEKESHGFFFDDDWYSFEGTDFSGSNLTGADLGMQVSRANFSNADLHEFEFHSQQLNDLEISKLDQKIVVGSCSSMGSLIQLNLETHSLESIRGKGCCFSLGQLAMNNENYIIEMRYGGFALWSFSPFELVFEHTFSKQEPNDNADEPDNRWVNDFVCIGNYLVFSTVSGYLFIYDIEKKEEVDVFKLAGFNSRLSANAKGTHLLMSGYGGYRLLSFPEMHIITTEEVEENESFIAYRTLFHPIENKYIYSDESRIRLFDLDAMNIVQEFEIDGVQDFFFIDNGEKILLYTSDEVVQLNYRSFKTLKRFSPTLPRSFDSPELYDPGRSFFMTNARFDNDEESLYISAHRSLVKIDLNTEKVEVLFVNMPHLSGSNFKGAKGLSSQMLEHLFKNGAISR